MQHGLRESRKTVLSTHSRQTHRGEELHDGLAEAFLVIHDEHVARYCHCADRPITSKSHATPIHETWRGHGQMWSALREFSPRSGGLFPTTTVRLGACCDRKPALQTVFTSAAGSSPTPSWRPCSAAGGRSTPRSWSCASGVDQSEARQMTVVRTSSATTWPAIRFMHSWSRRGGAGSTGRLLEHRPVGAAGSGGDSVRARPRIHCAGSASLDRAPPSRAPPTLTI